MKSEIINNNHLFFNDNIIYLLNKNDFKILYVFEMDLILACTTIQYPTVESDYLEVKGYIVNKYKDIKDLTLKMVEEIENIRDYPASSFTFSSKLTWIVYEDNMSVELKNIIKNKLSRI